MLKYQLQLFFFIAFCLLLLQCQKDPVIKRGRVYVAGVELSTDNSPVFSVAKLWIDAVEVELKTNGKSSQAEGVFATANDVYVGGTIYDGIAQAVVWKNGNPTVLSKAGEHGQAFGVFATTKDVYVTGMVYENGIGRVVVWKNGIETVLKDAVYTPWSIDVSNNNVYVGSGSLVNDTAYASVWKNGVQQIYERTAKSTWGEIMSVLVSGNDVYAAGNVVPAYTGGIPAIWKNGRLTLLERDNMQGWATDIAVTTSKDVYATGYLDSRCVLWKNNVISYLNDGGNGIGYSVAVSNRDVYVSGWGVIGAGKDYYVPVLWENNIPQELPTKSKHGIALSVFVR